MIVYEVQGWFGDIEWSEGLWLFESEANAECEQLWETRRSEHAPSYVQGLCKFAVEEREVRGYVGLVALLDAFRAEFLAHCGELEMDEEASHRAQAA